MTKIEPETETRYGSEYHLHRLFRTAPHTLTNALTETAELQGAKIEWLPFPSAPASKSGDRERKGMEFLTDEPEARAAWAQ